MMDGKMMMGGSAGPPEDESNEKPSVFLSAEQLGGRKVKAGQTLTLTVTDVDPETGDVQADLAGGGETNEDEGMMAQYDRAMPEESEEA